MYVSSNAPIPQNGTLPPPAACAAASDAAIARAQEISNSGRRRAYSTVATPADLVSVNIGVAGAAARILPQSELARRSIMTGGTPAVLPPSVRGSVKVPTIVPLNWIPGVEGVSGGVCLEQTPQTVAAATPVMMMPARAPRFASVSRRRRAPGPAGLSGYAPAWGDAAIASRPAGASVVADSGGFLSWVRSNPWLAVGLAGVGVAVLTQMERR